MTASTASSPWWAEFFESHDGAGYSRKHWSVQNRLGARPALLVVDVVRSFTGRPGQSLEEATAEYPTACGPTAWTSLPHLKKVIDFAEANDWPIVYTTAIVGGASLFGGTIKSELAGMGSPMDLPGAQEIPDEIKPPAGAAVIAKPKASAFFDTALLSYLIRRNVDSVVVTGTTTSGCVRATVIDAHSHGYPTFVVEEAVFDRSRLSHGVNLFEMNAKYADVVTVEQLETLATQGN
ncbi:isochorismatase family protein [Amycolatopsis rhabdoformis]|uniref:Isochorismatase family protein n=1 Tax=Amycolatopsis rhabdoformis TaxID=1448059 RepID=A0ABZ1IGM5_9PSEU|nr:isochorismatase family protein [Amycolatopsis rhabdoformis]WSE33537.1 isochorismatase family protein [Amycolatopsis rhabdoformis]